MTTDPVATALADWIATHGGPVNAEWDGAPDFPEPDMYVSPDEARHLDRRYQDWLERDAS